jgi:cysteine desulfurase
LGGEQEQGLRAGTLNVPGIAGFGAAALASGRDLGHAAEYARWRDAAEARLAKEAAIVVFGRDVPRLPNTSCFGSEGFAADRQMMGLDLAGVMVSAGSACSSGRMKPIAVLEQMGFGDLAGCAIRVSGGWGTSEQEWERFADAWLEAWRRHAARRAPAREYA